jgi:serine/threonine protein kinase/tetratricopeptide (TPR) repeat protein
MRLASYELETPLAAGGMGEVWLGRHQALGRPAAIKLIRPAALGGSKAEEVLQRFELEARSTSTLRSPHTIQIYDFGLTDDGSFFYAMELLDGCNLRHLVEKVGPVRAQRAAWILRQACESLEEAHRAGLIHRDIKPGNIHLCKLGLKYDFVKVLDFGLVKLSGESGAEEMQLTADGALQGTPAFMPPEVTRGASQVDSRYDIYALGCVAYWLVTGQLVFEALNPLAMMMAHVNSKPVPPSERIGLPLPADFEEVVLRCLEKDPDRRPQSASELYRLLGSCSFEEPWGEEQAETWWLVHSPETWGGVRPSLESGSRTSAGTLMSQPNSTRASVAVLPFENLSADPEQEYFSAGVAEDIIMELSRFKSLTVISRRSSFLYKDTDLNIVRIAQDLSVRYIVQGSVRRLGDRLRLTVELSDGHANKQLWGERYDRKVEDLFEVQADVVQRIVAMLAGRLEAASMAEVRRKSTVSMDAHDCMMRGMDLRSQTGSKSADEALEYFDRAIELDPDLAPAYAWYACTASRSSRWTGFAGELGKKATNYLDTAHRLDPDEPEVHRLLAAIAMYQGEIDKALYHQDRGLTLNPNNERMVCQQGEIYTGLGKGEKAVTWIRRAMELNPYHPPHWWGHLGRALHIAGRYEEALAAFRRLPSIGVFDYVFMAACCVALERNEEARGYADEVLALNPKFQVEDYVRSCHYRKAEDNERILAQFRQAGLPG